ncbi:hypothetical protein [Bythopirellula polymerisocia]|uniref:Beta-glucosidase n=1 Tax=Bythopirellula polymerisocia TaxID=2528003 RepID=A0A5C6D180_9BACT|nr:hypothetical protein [Bythopirellula polymerisocia]TWU28649.1 hypothetical protein Pla144_19410 [Bythopirellula polymerisocia]
MSKMPVFTAAFLTAYGLIPLSSATDVLYQDQDQPIEMRVEDLLSRMTIQEKVNQLTSDYAKTTHRKNGPGQSSQSRIRKICLCRIPSQNARIDSSQCS